MSDKTKLPEDPKLLNLHNELYAAQRHAVGAQCQTHLSNARILLSEFREQRANVKLDAGLWSVITEMQKSADPRAIEWANRLELTNVALLADVYDQCCEAIEPLVNAEQLPGSVVESVQMMVKERMDAAKEKQ